jgi:hypothetical protein
MTGYTRWTDIRAAHVERAGGEHAVEAGEQGMRVTIVGTVRRSARAHVRAFLRRLSRRRQR